MFSGVPFSGIFRWHATASIQEAPAYRVGNIMLSGPVLPPAICDDPENFINSSINTLPEHQGLGRISRAEAVAAPASIARRTPG